LNKNSIDNKLIGLNKLIDDVFQNNYKISDILKKNGLSNDEIKVIMNEKLEIYMEYCVYALQVSFVGSFAGNRQAEILVMRYGLNGNVRCTLKEVGYKFSISSTRIRQIQMKIIRKLKTSSSKAVLEDVILFSACKVLNKEFLFRKSDRHEICGEVDELEL
jgi:DNA-binding CsgD family transcriptional regulator